MTDTLLPTSPSDVDTEHEPRCVSFEEADAMIEALGSGTARRIVAALGDRPMTASRLADRVDTSLQNVTYHLRRLVEAGLVDVVDTCYSRQGQEMDVYAPASRPVVICVGDDDSEDTVASLVEGGSGFTSGPGIRE